MTQPNDSRHEKTSEATSAEEKLAKAGVFKGHHGLRGLADAQEFWDRQPYGSRLYYGDYASDYLHRSVLQAAVKILDGPVSDKASEAEELTVTDADNSGDMETTLLHLSNGQTAILDPVAMGMLPSDESDQQAEAEPVVSEHVPEATRTAPEVIWLQHGDEEHHAEEPFPVHQGDASWCNHQVFPADVKYVRADLTPPAPAPVVPPWKDPFTNNGDERSDTAYRMGWNDCRERVLSSAPQQHSEVPEDWSRYESLANHPSVYEALQGFSEDPTGDSGTAVVRAVCESLLSSAPQQHSSVPDGWQLVPKKSTPEMHRAADMTSDPWVVWGQMHAAAPQPEQKEEPQGTEKYRYCNHHHELTDDHCMVDFGDGEFVANRAAVPLLRALNDMGIRTRTHHVGESHCFVGILMDNVSIEVRPVHERDADRDRYNGKMELLVCWDRKSQPEQEKGHE